MTQAQRKILTAMKAGARLVYHKARDRWRLEASGSEPRTIPETTIDSLCVQALISQRGPEMFLTDSALAEIESPG